MSAPSALLLVDEHKEQFRPLSWTRPLSELLFGAETFRARLARVSGLPLAGVCSAGRFEGLGFDRLGGPRLRVGPREPPQGPALLLDSLYVPPPGGGPLFAPRERPARFWLDGRTVGAWLEGAELAAALEAINARGEWRDAARTGEDVEIGGGRPVALHRLVARNAEQIVGDLESGAAPGGAPPEAPGVTLEGPREAFRADPGVEIPGPIHVDVREGPVRLGRDVRVEPFTTLRGPLVVHAGARLLGSAIGPGCTVGMHCKVRGEVQGAIFLGYSNKAHDGFVGDSYVGEWVNLGAGTTTSNLKNNYGYVRLRLDQEVLETGLLKLGSLIGDHVKTGIGTLLPTGAVIGPGSNLYGTQGMAPTFLPAFSWGAATRRETHRLDAFLASARRAMERRGVALEPEEAGMLGAVFRATESERIAV